MRIKLVIIALVAFKFSFAQEISKDTTLPSKDTVSNLAIPRQEVESPLRIMNLSPFFSLQADSILTYDFKINKPIDQYFWYLKSAPIGLKIDKNSGILYFKADKNLFKSGRLKFDIPYKVEFGVQNLRNAADRIDTSFNLLFFSTEINITRLKPTVGNFVQLEEGDTIRFRIQCEEGSFPMEQITINANLPITNFKPVKTCNDEFQWTVPYDFIREGDTAKQKVLVLQFIGTDSHRNNDTASVRLYIKPGVNYPQKMLEYKLIADEMNKYIKDLKLAFFILSNEIEQTKKNRTYFDVGSSSTAMLGTILSTSAQSTGAKNFGKVLPSLGLTLVPVKEAVSPNKVQEQNVATQIRGTIKRLEFMLTEYGLVGEKDIEILTKTKKLKDELKQSQLQLIDLPLVEFDPRYTQEDAEKYFNNPKVNKKYKMKIF
ncbi:MAG: hypothetical protein EBU73_05610 [Chitinophagia bacterium]|nr:hypothetical protein [Chitinophagia bacterium]